jgi:hypothetical protein
MSTTSPWLADIKPFSRASTDLASLFQESYIRPPPRQAVLRRAPPTPNPEPAESAASKSRGKEFCYPAIIDIRFGHHGEDIERRVERFARQDIVKDSRATPEALMRSRIGKDYAEPDLRWVHIPYNSMADVEVQFSLLNPDFLCQQLLIFSQMQAILDGVCKDLQLSPDARPKAICPGQNWVDRLHMREGDADGHHATYMQTTCFEINIGETTSKL